MTEASAQGREILLALVDPVEGRDEEFREWYWGAHIRDVLGVPGFVSAQRYRASDDDAPRSHRYATIYEVEGSAVDARDRLFSAGIGMSDALDLSTMVFAPFRAEGDPLTA